MYPFNATILLLIWNTNIWTNNISKLSYLPENCSQNIFQWCMVHSGAPQTHAWGPHTAMVVTWYSFCCGVVQSIVMINHLPLGSFDSGSLMQAHLGRKCVFWYHLQSFNGACKPPDINRDFNFLKKSSSHLHNLYVLVMLKCSLFSWLISQDRLT